jgi:hypothetical protein
MLVEPASLCWLAGHKAGRRDGATWAEQLVRWPALRAVIRDDGTGLGKGVRLVNERRAKLHHPDLEDGLDVFHLFREAGRASRVMWAGARRAMQDAEVAQARMDRRRAQGLPCRGHGTTARRLWDRAERAFDQATAADAAWGQARGAFDLFNPEGRLNDRGQAVAVTSAALPRLSGPAWAKVRRLLARPESFTFLDQAGRRLGALGLGPDVLKALLDLEGLRRQPWRRQGETTAAAAARGLALARMVQLEKELPAWREQATRVAGVLRGVWRASSLVECVNSVARMQQARHRVMTQGLLDLKRLYWNLRRFRTGIRKGRSPYSELGLKLPELSFWEFLKLTPEELRQQLSAKDDTP